MRAFARAILFFLCLACSLAPSAMARKPQPPPPTTYFPGVEWRRATPASQGLDAARLAALVERLRSNQIAELDSLLVIRNGYLVTEEYFNGSGPDDVHTLQSVSKSVTSLLVGIAMQRGYLHDVGQRVLDFFPEYSPISNLDARKEALTLRHLLTMRTGLDWSEDDYATSPLRELNECRCDWLRFVLDYPMREWPGSRFEYNSGGVILLGGILRRGTGMDVDDFAAQELFTPLGIRDAWWYQGLPPGLPHMGGGLNLRARDMARIGYLMLRRGRWGSRQILSSSWWAESVRHWVRAPRTFYFYPTDYGYLWWLLPLVHGASHTDIYTAAGARDQWIFAIPRYDMVVVVTGDTTSSFAQPVDFLYREILPAVRR